MKSNPLFSFSWLILTSLLLMGCSPKGQESSAPALFETKEEAQKAAKDFGCKGAHKMGDKWMPCKMHKNHQHN